MNETYVHIKVINMTCANVEDNNVTCVCMKHISVKYFEVNDCCVKCAEGTRIIDNVMCKERQ